MTEGTFYSELSIMEEKKASIQDKSCKANSTLIVDGINKNSLIITRIAPRDGFLDIYIKNLGNKPFKGIINIQYEFC